MNETPEALLQIADEAVREHPGDIQAARRAVADAVAEREDRDELNAWAVAHSHLELVYDARHKLNGRFKRDAGQYGGPAKVDRLSPTVLSIKRSVYDMPYAGKALGDLTREDFLAYAESEKGKSNGHLVNVRFSRKMARLVPEGKTVRESVRADELHRMLKGHGIGEEGPPLAEAGH